MSPRRDQQLLGGSQQRRADQFLRYQGLVRDRSGGHRRPGGPHEVFAWKLTRTEDPFGNRIEYEYERDSAEEGPHHWDQLYLAKIRYVDYDDDHAQLQFLVTVEFDYEQRRDDPFSEYRSGFEIRTRKRCTRIVVRTHAENEQLVRSYDLVYLDQRPELKAALPINGVSLLSQVKVIGYDGDKAEMLPPLEFRYTRFEPEKRDFFPLQGSDLPARSLANPDLELVDLFGNGLPDLVEMNGTVRYWRNLGNGRFDMPRFMQDAPAGLALADAGVQFIDANGDGRTDLLVTNACHVRLFSAPLRRAVGSEIIPALSARLRASTSKTRRSNWSISTAMA